MEEILNNEMYIVYTCTCTSCMCFCTAKVYSCTLNVVRNLKLKFI